MCIRDRFYIIDSFEIYHFLPLYRLLREKGVYAIFVLEDESRNASGKWVDYKNAKQILDDKEVEYSEYYNEKMCIRDSVGCISFS